MGGEVLDGYPEDQVRDLARLEKRPLDPGSPWAYIYAGKRKQNPLTCVSLTG